MAPTAGARAFNAGELDALLQALRAEGWTLAGPRIRDGAIVYDEIGGAAELPAGWTDEQAPGRYRLRERDDRALFGYAVGPHAWKKYLFPPSERLWTAVRSGRDVGVSEEQAEPPPLAFIGVRACELAAIAVQDRVFLGGERADASYRRRRENVLIVAVQCGEAGGNCFCVSMGTGPAAASGYDIALTELVSGGHRFHARAGSERGARLLSRIETRAATGDDEEAVRALLARAGGRMGRTLDTRGLPQLLQANLEHRRWDEVAGRCLACSNCTLACPTCFCSAQEDVPDLAHARSERWRRWDSCFTGDFSYLHGGSVRASIRSRYRQWLTHKLSAWHEQFGSCGCVGCGRCITWCPVGIDLTEDVAAIRSGAGAAQQERREQDT
ncbi:MAG: 4Fe-4S dicluster domain-containing protein [Burkholderiales bacterium]|nr:4Fe-4S dicluster domain-containing protein [Burkholderiales bacterium]